MEDGPTERAPQAIDRRKLLLGIGFGVTNAALLRHVASADAPIGTGGSAPPTTTSPGPSSPGSDLAAPSGAGPASPASLPEATAAAPETVFDTVVAGGRVMDPETGYDRIANIGIDGTSIAHIGEAPLEGRATIDASGLVVAPGFVDILSYAPNGYGEWWKIADGVTTNLAMHGLRFEPEDFFGRWTGEGSPVHFGGSIHTDLVRRARGYDIGDEIPPEQLDAVAAACADHVRAGYVGIHAQPEYTPGMTTDELVAYGRAAADLDAPLTVHARYSDNLEPGTNLEAVDELVRVARESGAWVHVEHINSTGGTGVMSEALGRIESARAEGLPMTACIYPYTFWATTLQTTRFDNWQEKYGISYGDLQVAGRSERLTAATYQEAFDQNLLTAAYAMSEADLETAISAPFVMVGSDAILETDHNNHPRATGCFARTIAEFVRERRLIGLMDALSRMTILPAQMVGTASPAMRRKGRLQVGADADITVFDPATITDNATVADPGRESTGVRHVLVGGTRTRGPAGNVESALAGTAVRAEVQ